MTGRDEGERWLILPEIVCDAINFDPDSAGPCNRDGRDEEMLLLPEILCDAIHYDGGDETSNDAIPIGDDPVVLELAGAIEKLPAREKAIIALSQMGRTRPQIAKQLGVSPKIVGQWMASARDHLASNVS